MPQRWVARMNQWILLIPIALAVVAATGTWLRFENLLDSQATAIKEVQDRLDRTLSHGVNGFADPELRGLLDHYTRLQLDTRFVTQREFMEWKKLLFQINKTLERPWMDKDP